MAAPVDQPPTRIRLVKPSAKADDDDEDHFTLPPDGDMRPQVQIHVNLHTVVNKAIEAWASRDAGVFTRSGGLVAVVEQGEPEPQPKIFPLSAPAVSNRLMGSIRFIRKGAKGWVSCMPTPRLVSELCARGEWPGVRPLISVSTSPCLRPDGTVLQSEGYDESTGILYKPNERYAEVPESPTWDEANAALGALREVVCDFPFARPEHEAAWMAGVLTILARPAIRGPCPLFAVDATTRGTGKSRLVDAAVRLATGSDAARTSLPEDDEEMRKRITALMVEGDPAICLDNITRPVALPSIDAVVTSTTWKDRVLGRTASVASPARAVWWATGNNLKLMGDLSRRSLHIRLESPLENPEERHGFKHPELLRWVRRERSRLVPCALTILRAHAIAKDKPDVGILGSFEDWSRIVPSALIWAGASNPLLARGAQVVEFDEEKTAIAVIVDALKRICAAVEWRPVTSKEIVSAMYPANRAGPPDGFDLARETIEEETRCLPGKALEPRRLGKWLQRVRGRVVDGWAIERVDGPAHTATWRAVAHASPVEAH